MADDVDPKKHFRLAFGIEYNGAKFNGWQYQPDLPTIHGEIWQALLKLFGDSFTKNKKKGKSSSSFSEFLPSNIVAAGRTDRGVHAKNQVIHIDIPKKFQDRPDESWLRGMNNYLPNNIRVHWSAKVGDDFNARKSATLRHYRYYLQITKTPSAILQGIVGNYWQPLNINNIKYAANYLVGEHDFTTFRSSECQARSAIRRIIEIRIHEIDQPYRIIIFDFLADGFLHHMVRNIIGSLVEVGCGNQQPIWINQILKAKNRTFAAKTFMPDGLYLWNVEYLYPINKLFN